MNTLPDNLPPLPEGAVYLGFGNSFETGSLVGFIGWTLDPAEDPRDRWKCGSWSGKMSAFHYAAPANSEVVKLNTTPSAPSHAVSYVVGCTAGGPPFEEFKTLELAVAEAKRLAVLHPNNPFSVYARVRSYVASLTITETQS